MTHPCPQPNRFTSNSNSPNFGSKISKSWGDHGTIFHLHLAKGVVLSWTLIFYPQSLFVKISIWSAESCEGAQALAPRPGTYTMATPEYVPCQPMPKGWWWSKHTFPMLWNLEVMVSKFFISSLRERPPPHILHETDMTRNIHHEHIFPWKMWLWVMNDGTATKWICQYSIYTDLFFIYIYYWSREKLRKHS